jgi:5-keto 4-deoxyuronate isomerase
MKFAKGDARVTRNIKRLWDQRPKGVDPRNVPGTPVHHLYDRRWEVYFIFYVGRGDKPMQAEADPRHVVIPHNPLLVI